MTVTLTVDLDEATLARLDAMARETDSSREGLVRDALDSFLMFEAEQVGRIREGLDQADRGAFAPDEEVSRILSKYRPA